MSEDIVYEQYIDDMKHNVNSFNKDIMNYTENKDDDEDKNIQKDVEEINKIPFHMKVFQRRMKKFTSYQENQKFIRRQNKVIHTKVASIKDEDK